MEMVAATERLRAAALQEAGALAVSSPDAPDGLMPHPPPASSLFAQVQRQFTGEEVLKRIPLLPPFPAFPARAGP